jgi:hypothetical protein
MKKISDIKERGEEKLISFDKVFERCQDPNCMSTCGRPLVLSESQKESIRLLKKELRNKMEHYVPSGWSIEIHGMPQIAIDALRVDCACPASSVTCHATS